MAGFDLGALLAMAAPSFGGFQMTSPAVMMQQAKARAQQEIAPAMGMLQGQLSQGLGQIGSLSSALSSSMGAIEPQVAGAYREATSGQAAADVALMNRLTGTGQDVSQSLASGLAQAGQPTGPADMLARMGRESGNALFAGGSAELSALLSQGAAARTWAAGQPGIARLAGSQASGQFSRGIGNAMGELGAKLPGLTQDIYGQMAGAEADAMAKEQAREDSWRKLIFQSAMSLLGKMPGPPKPSSSASNLYGDIVDEFGNPIEGAPAYESPAERAARTVREGRAKARKKAAEKAATARKEAIGRVSEARSQIEGAAVSRATELAKGYKVMEMVTEKKGGVSTQKEKKVTRYYTHSQAGRKLYEEMTAKYASDLRRYGIKPMRVRQIVDSALRAAGFTPGRPLTTVGGPGL